ncbi:flagellar basal body-associated protein FliL [Sulfurimonas sp.]|jgi:flagellar FliL protein|uniref:flagellar basal body-associated protein FliL n=1 Tax=Sulfurimonas sp. TaxID=2022749 RepID=UPI003D096B2C
MADKEKKEEESTSSEGKKSNTLMIIIIVVLLLIIIAGAVVAFLLMGEDEKTAQTPQQVEQAATPQAQQKSTSSRSKDDGDEMGSKKLSQIGTLYPLDAFTVNLKSDAGRRYLKTTISLELNGKELSLELDSKTPVIRDRIIRILTSKTLEEISSKKGKQKISEQIMDTLNSMITDGSIEGIYFTEFVIQ